MPALEGLSAAASAAMLEVDNPRSAVVRFPETQPLQMDAGVTLAPLTIAYQTYGTLNEDRSNAVLVCHALTGDQYLATTHLDFGSLSIRFGCRVRRDDHTIVLRSQ